MFEFGGLEGLGDIVLLVTDACASPICKGCCCQGQYLQWLLLPGSGLL